MDAYTEELFGPVLAVLRVETLDEAIALIGDSPIHGPEGIRFCTCPKVITT
jgi:acyl-CoA reductase-like NAD-dependent aldehyde dehydrogenase